MLRLHYAPDNASLIVRLWLEELGLDYRTVLVDRRAQGQKAPAYLALNPRGLIPVLETEDGPIFETAAVLLWLSDRHPGRAPAPDAAQRGAFLSWLFAVSNGLHAELRRLFYPGLYGDEAAQVAALQGQIGGLLDQLEALAGRSQDWFGANIPGPLDVYVAALLRWCALYPVGGTDWFSLGGRPHLAALARRVEARPAALRAAAAEGLGPTPFSAPRYADPPEGSAT
ncbi:MAG: glutathione S-transferase family protein [Maritimibacter sp.]|nr:glutathione S-transferase family protein [Maritimibacter sp.]